MSKNISVRVSDSDFEIASKICYEALRSADLAWFGIGKEDASSPVQDAKESSPSCCNTEFRIDHIGNPDSDNAVEAMSLAYSVDDLAFPLKQLRELLESRNFQYVTVHPGSESPQGKLRDIVGCRTVTLQLFVRLGSVPHDQEPRHEQSKAHSPSRVR